LREGKSLGGGRGLPPLAARKKKSLPRICGAASWGKKEGLFQQSAVGGDSRVSSTFQRDKTLRVPVHEQKNDSKGEERNFAAALKGLKG